MNQLPQERQYVLGLIAEQGPVHVDYLREECKAYLPNKAKHFPQIMGDLVIRGHVNVIEKIAELAP